MKKILILDDEQDLLDLWFIHFKTWGFKVEIHTALNGKEFIQEVRSLDDSNKPPIFFFTGYLPELTDYVDKLDNVLFFDNPLVTDKMKTHIKMCLGKD